MRCTAGTEKVVLLGLGTTEEDKKTQTDYNSVPNPLV